VKAGKFALVDRDGTLFSTCWANFYAYKDAFQSFNLSFNENSIIGFHEGVSRSELSRRYFHSIELDLFNEIANLKTEIFMQYVKCIAINFELLEQLNEYESWHIVSNASRRSTIDLVEAFLPGREIGVFNPGSSVLAKPNPGIFLHAIEALSWKGFDVEVFEDSTIGQTAALSAGLKVRNVRHFCQRA
jgi:beta-phosphoglucomutase-like phosphatase (HAD superfamily)